MEVVRLNIGGRQFVTSRATLSKALFFEPLLSGDWETEKLPDGSVFIDRSPRYFEDVLQYLRTGTLHFSLHSRTTFSEFFEDSVFYGIEDMTEDVFKGWQNCRYCHGFFRPEAGVNTLIGMNSRVSRDAHFPPSYDYQIRNITVSGACSHRIRPHSNHATDTDYIQSISHEAEPPVYGKGEVHEIPGAERFVITERQRTHGQEFYFLKWESYFLYQLRKKFGIEREGEE